MLLNNSLIRQNKKLYEDKVIKTILIVLLLMIANSIILCNALIYNINTYSSNYNEEENFTRIYIITQYILIKQIEKDESFARVYIIKTDFEYYFKTSETYVKISKIEETITFHNYNLRLENEFKHDRFPFKIFYWLTTTNYKPFRKRKRSKLEIYAQIIEYLQSDFLNLNEIAFYTGLNYKTTKKYIEFLLMNELIDIVSIKGKTYYKASLRGIQFIKYFKEINGLLKYKNK
jgi:predicted transcriptional regulator